MYLKSKFRRLTTGTSVGMIYANEDRMKSELGYTYESAVTEFDKRSIRYAVVEIHMTSMASRNMKSGLKIFRQ